MLGTIFRLSRRAIRRALRKLMARLPRSVRFAIIRRMIDCEPNPDSRLEFGIAKTRAELAACFAVLHDSYVTSGYMLPSPSGMRVTIYHALPTTTTLYAKFDGVVVGTMSLVREGIFGFPLQSAFDLSAIRARGGNIAEISALAIKPSFRKTGGSVLFPLMKFMYEYCRTYFDTRHLVIAVNPKMIELYEALLFFERLSERPIDRYAFANGAPAVGATLDLDSAHELFKSEYNDRSPRKNLFKYFAETSIVNIKWPNRTLHLTNDPVMTVDLLDYFFNQRTAVFAGLDTRQRELLKSVYSEPEFASVLPAVSVSGDNPAVKLRRDPRFTLRCPANFRFETADATGTRRLTMADMSRQGCQAETDTAIPPGTQGTMVVEWGQGINSRVDATVVRHHLVDRSWFLCFSVEQPDQVWQICIDALQSGHTAADLLTLEYELAKPIGDQVELRPAHDSRATASGDVTNASPAG